MRAEDAADRACTARIRFGDVVEIEVRSKKRVYFGTANFPAFIPAKTLEREITVPLSKQTLKNIARSVYFRVRIEKTMERLGLPSYRFDPEERIVDFRADRKARIAVFILDEAFGYRVRLFSPNGEKTFVSTTPNIDIREAIARAFDVHLPKDRIPDWEELETIIAMRAIAGRT